MEQNDTLLQGYSDLEKGAYLGALWCLCCSGQPPVPFSGFLKAFITGYQQLGIPEHEYDYKDYFSRIQPADGLDRQDVFFRQQEQGLAAYAKSRLSERDRLSYDHLAYEIRLNRDRIRLEKRWVAAGRPVPDSGLYLLPDRKEWYAFFIRWFTSTGMTPEEIYAMGSREVNRCRREIAAIRQRQGFSDDSVFYRHLAADSFLIREEAPLVAGFVRIDSMVRVHLPAFTGNTVMPPVAPVEWKGAGPQTPPGAYLNRTQTVSGKDAFLYNFYNRQFNRRAMEWLYLHEAIPGHHLQSSWPMRQDGLEELFYYSGHFEGWACYVEYFGESLGLYQDPYALLGKWEWDLVRSARLVIDAGIHYYGWTRQQALDYWRATIPGQDAIAAREISRVTAWPAQALSYKVGADCIFRLKERWLRLHPEENAVAFHRWYLDSGRLPLAVLEAQLPG